MTNKIEWKVIGKSVIGTSHLKSGRPCQDALKWIEDENKTILALADGHSSNKCPFSEIGSNYAVNIAVKHFESFYNEMTSFAMPYKKIKHHAEENLAKYIVRAWSESVEKDFMSKQNLNQIVDYANQDCKATGIKNEEQAKDNKIELHDVLIKYGSTLIAVIVSSEFLLFFQLGDGDILVVDNNGLCNRPMPMSDHIGEDTDSLSSPNVWFKTHIRLQPILEEPPALIIVSTDGYSKSFLTDDDFLKTGEDLINYINKNGVEYIENNLEDWLKEISRLGSNDDISLACIYRKDLISKGGPDDTKNR